MLNSKSRHIRASALFPASIINLLINPYWISKLSVFSFTMVVLNISPLFSQGELDTQPRFLYRNEKSGGVYLNSSGLGAGFRFGQRINARSQYIYEADLLSINHPKEIKISNNIYSNRSFVFGKENTFLELRAMYGKQNEIFRKNDRGGVAVRYLYSGGPALGFIKPVYYEVLYATSNPFDFQLKTEKFNTSIHQSNIYGRASIFKGLNEVTLTPGVSVKTGFSFEYSRMDIVLHSLEAGFSLDVFAKKIPIMANERNEFYFLNLFVSYRFGRYIDISEAALAKRSTEDGKVDRKVRRKAIREQRNMEKEENYF